MTSRLADPARSRIVLIGTPAHEHAGDGLPDVPEVANNIADLAAVFTDPALGGFDTDHCVATPAGIGMRELGEVLHDAAAHAEHLLLIYYAGHGLLDRRGELHLALAGTHPDQLGFTALPYETLREVCYTSRARLTVVILDSCFSGRAISRALAPDEVMGQLDLDGTYTLTSAPANRTARIVPGERHTAFTGRLLDLLRDGDPAGGPVLTIDRIFEQLHRRLRAADLPVPQKCGTNTAHLLGLVRNNGLAARPSAEEASAPAEEATAPAEAEQVPETRTVQPPPQAAIASRRFAAAAFLASAVGMVLLLTTKLIGWQDDSSLPNQYASIISASPNTPGSAYTLMLVGIALLGYPTTIALLALASVRAGIRRLKSASIVAIVAVIWSVLSMVIALNDGSHPYRKWVGAGFWGVLATSVLAAVALGCAEWKRDRSV